jgi:hypothetical protein
MNDSSRKSGGPRGLPSRPPASKTAPGVLRVEPDGRVHGLDEAATQALGGHQGTWRYLPSSGDLLVLRRISGPDGGDVGRPGITLCGTIGGTEDLIRIINMVHTHSESGALHVCDRTAHRTLYFHNGKLLAGLSDRAEDSLPAMLLRTGALPHPEESLYPADSPAQQGQDLVNRGLLTTHQLYEGLRRQAEDIFEAVLFQPSGVFYLTKPLDRSAIPAMLYLDLQELLFDALRRNDELNHLRSVVPSVQVVLGHAGATIPDDLAPAAMRLLRSIDGRSLQQLMDELHLDELEVTSAAAALISCGCATILGTAAEREDDETAAARHLIATYGEAFRLLLRAPEARTCGLDRSLSLFLSSAAGHSQMLAGAFSAGGELEGEALLTALRRGQGVTPRQLHAGLNELLFFLLFELGRTLDRTTVERMQSQVLGLLASAPR